MPELIDTIYWQDFQKYYHNAARLQMINIASDHGRDTTEPLHVDDPLMHYVTIYDTVDREFAGFSNAIQQIWFADQNPKKWQIDPRFTGYTLHPMDWMWLFLVHRVTGSGASFSWDHGFRNSILADMALAGDNMFDQRDYVLSEMRRGRPVFTSIGNQIPMFPKPDGFYRRGSERYIAEYMPILVSDMWHHLEDNPMSMSIRENVDWVHDWHKAHGIKRFHFVMTAWVMDIAFYFPDLIDPWSQVNYGKNATEALHLLFGNGGFKNDLAFLDAAMDRICAEFRSPNDERDLLHNYGKGLSLEDVACDYVRYVECYVPAGYEHLEPWQVTNNSLVPEHEKHWTYYKHLEKWKQVCDVPDHG